MMHNWRNKLPQKSLDEKSLSFASMEVYNYKMPQNGTSGICGLR
jgi:hypothetical protein